MKSISDILNSMVQPTEQNSLLNGYQAAPAQGSNPSTGSFSDVLNRLSAQNSNAANVPSNTANGNTAGSNAQNTGSTGISNGQITVTEVQVSETVQANHLNQTTLSNIENAAVSMALALSKLVNLASQAQNLNQTQAQNLLVSAGGGAISASQAQQLVTQIANLKNQNNGQNALSLTPEQQNALLLQMMQSMLQNQQITLTQPSDTQNNQNALSSGSQGSSLLQFNFAGNQNGQNGSAQVESISIDIQTLNLQVSNSSQPPQGLPNNPPQSANLTDATAQKLTQLLQQLNVTPSNAPVNIQVQSSVASANSPELAKNFQNLVQVLTQAGAGQAVLNNYLTQNKNNDGQVFHQLPQNQNAAVTQSVSVTAVSGNESINSALISNNGGNNSSEDQARLLNDSLNGQNIQLSFQGPQVQNGNQVQAAVPAANVPIPQTPAANVAQTAKIQPTNGQPQTTASAANAQAPQAVAAVNAAPSTGNQPQAAIPEANAQVPQVLTAAHTAQNTPVQAGADQPQAVPVTNVQAPQAPTAVHTAQNVSAQPANNQLQPAVPVVGDVAQTTPIQPTDNQSRTAVPVTNNPAPQTLVVANTVQTPPAQPADNQPQPATPVNTQTTQVTAVTTQAQNTQNQTAANPNSQTVLSQPEDVFSNGQLEAINGIVARFNSAVVSGQAVNANSINLSNNINQFPTETQAQTQVSNPVVPVQTTVPASAVTPLTQAVNDATNVVLNNQNTQQTNNLTGNNIQNQLAEPTSPTTQQVINTINDSAQDAFVQTGVNTPVNNLAGPTVTTPGLNTTNNSTTTVNPPVPVTSAAPAAQQVVTANQATVVIPSASSTPGVPVSVSVSSPVVTQPVVNPASVTAQNVPAATVTGETAKASVPALVSSNADSNSNAPAVTAVTAVSAASSIQPATAQAVSQTATTSETATNLNTAGNSSKDTLADTANLQNLASTVNSGMTAATADKTANSFQNTVNTVANSNPNGSVDSAQILSQIAQQVASQTADAKMVSRLTFQLVPESLGRVTVQVALVDQSISARITVSNPDVREVLQQHMVDLKAALSQAGLQIDQMQVQVQGGGSNLLAQYYQYQQEGNAYRESAWSPANTPEQAQNADNPGVLTAVGSSSVLNLLV